MRFSLSQEENVIEYGGNCQYEAGHS